MLQLPKSSYPSNNSFLQLFCVDVSCKLSHNLVCYLHVQVVDMGVVVMQPQFSQSCHTSSASMWIRWAWTILVSHRSTEAQHLKPSHLLNGQLVVKLADNFQVGNSFLAVGG